MVRGISVLALTLATLCGCAIDILPSYDTTPYIWPRPIYGVPFTVPNFIVRYSDWWNTPEEVRAVVARYCGPAYDVARVTSFSFRGTLIHPKTLNVTCGSSPQPLPLFRGQNMGNSYLMSLLPPVPAPTAAPQ